MRILLLCGVLFWLATGSAIAEQPRVVASIEPLAMVARQVLGDDARVETLLRPAQNLHSASLTPGQARAIRDADLLVWLGADAEPQLAPLVARREGRTLALLDLPGVVVLHGSDSGHEAHDEHDHGELGIDPHLWLSMENMRLLGGALAERVPGASAAAFVTELDDTEKALRRQLAPYRDRPWLSQHDPWAYFHRALPLAAPLVISEGSPRGASSRRMMTLMQRMESENVRCAIAEPEARMALVEKLCKGECRIVTADPLGRDRAGEHYTVFLREIGARFARCLGE